MKKSKKQLWCTILAASLLASAALSGCGGNNNGSSQQSSSTPSSQSSSTSTDDDSSGGESGGSLYTEPGTYPIVNEPVKLTIAISQIANTIDYNTNDYTLLVEDLTGLDLEFQGIPEDAVNEKVNLMFATQDLPDMFYRIDVDENRYGVDEGQLIDLTNFVDMMPELQKVVEETPNILSAMTATDGKLYEFPFYNDCYHCTLYGKMWVNTKHLEDMNEEAPTTIDEFYELCKKFKAQNPNGIAICGNTGDTPINFIANAYTYRGGDARGMRLSKDGTVETAITTDEYREALKFMNKMYSEGLMYEALFTTTNDQEKSILVEDGEPVLFFPGLASCNLIDGISTPELYSHYYPIAPLKGPEGVQTCTWSPTTPSGGASITTACKETEAAARLVDYLYSYEASIGQYTGIEGRDWVWDTNHEWLGANGEPADVVRLVTYSQEPQNRCWQDRELYRSSARRFGESAYKVGEEPDLLSIEGLEPMLYKASKELYEPYIPTEWSPLPQISLTVDENNSLQTIRVELENYIKESAVEFITGAKDSNDDSTWQAYVDSVNSIGMPQFIEVYQTAYDRQYK